jgi:hypothetical protein
MDVEQVGSHGSYTAMIGKRYYNIPPRMGNYQVPEGAVTPDSWPSISRLTLMLEQYNYNYSCFYFNFSREQMLG